MTRLFDGMASLLTGVFGAPVSYTPAGGVTRAVASVFRETPIEAIDQDGHPILIMGPTWRVQKQLVPEVKKGDVIDPGNGKIYSIRNVQPTGSPATDAAVICELERIVTP